MFNSYVIPYMINLDHLGLVFCEQSEECRPQNIMDNAERFFDNACFNKPPNIQDIN